MRVVYLTCSSNRKVQIGKFKCYLFSRLTNSTILCTRIFGVSPIEYNGIYFQENIHRMKEALDTTIY